MEWINSPRSTNNNVCRQKGSILKLDSVLSEFLYRAIILEFDLPIYDQLTGAGI